MRKYWEFFKIDFWQALQYRSASLGKIFFYGIILYVFSKLWEVTGKTENLGLSPNTLVWYLALTELLVLSYPYLHTEIDEDVRSGNLAYSLLRPASYLWSRYFRGFGSVLARFFILLVGGLIFPLLFGGGWPENPLGLLLFFPLAFASLSVGIIFHISVGICSFWIQDSNPIYWVWQKLMFILGGLILPFEIYPEWLKTIAWYSPFPYLLNMPVMASLEGDIQKALSCLLAMAAWFVVGSMLATILFLFARRSLVLNGG
ncbi:MAG: ABC-2 family transporter protein [Oligoflexia bacterium]|nr:ABC-2 family transporter protein [Oligoflexia bacterium]